MIRSLLLLYARDSEHIKNDLLLQLEGVPSYCICIDDPKFQHHHALKNSTKSRLQIVFFSPGFLSFLECRPEEAYSSFKDLDPLCTVALFCCDLREYDVMCYHTAPLTSYNSWPKFEAISEGEKSNGFSPYLMQLIQEAFPTENGIARNIIVVPQVLDKECSDVYVIFPNVIHDMADISVHIQSNSNIHITPEIVNPYVIQFKVPVMLLENCQTFSVQIQQCHAVIVEKVLRIAQDHAASSEKLSREDSKLKMTSKVIQLEEQLQVLSDIGGLSLEDTEWNPEERQCTLLPSEEEMNCSLVNMCKKYGLEELSLFLEEPPIPKEKCMTGSNRNSFDEQICFNLNAEDKENVTTPEDANASLMRSSCAATIVPTDDDEVSMISRSISLPSVLPPSEEFPNTYGDYLPMMFTNGKPSFAPYPSADAISLSESCMSGSTYVCMKLNTGDTLDAAKKILSKSQQKLLELMFSFKKGKTGISEVEKRFQLWQQKHSKQSKPQDNEPEEMAKYPFSFFGGWRRNARKASNESASDSSKRLSSSSVQSRLSSIETRKSSSASASSSSSKTSEASNLTARRSITLPREVSTGWIPTYTTAPVCPLNPESNPPPLPTTPRPNSRPKMEVDKPSRTESFAKRKMGTHLYPIVSELDNTSTDSEDVCKEEVMESLFTICAKYGLEHLAELFVSEVCSDKDVTFKNSTSKDENLPKNEIKNEYLLQLSSNEWDQDTTPSFRRSMSLPSTLFPTEAKNDVNNTERNPDHADRQERIAASIFKCEDYMNSIHSNIYTSIAYSTERGVNPSVMLSGRQQELLKLLNDFKRGEKTMSQVEEQFQEWQQKHTNSSSFREQQLMQLKDQYEKAQKSYTFGIKNFIPKKSKKKNPKASTVNNGKSAKHSVSKTEGDSKRLSKISFTSTSSGVSDNGDVCKNVCYFNPEYGETTQEITSVGSFKRSASSPVECNPPPPLPPRPPLTPVAILRTCYTNSKHVEAVEPPGKEIVKSEVPLTEKSKHKPNLPPKPPNLFSKVSGFSELTNEKEEEKVSESETRPESPDYITPNKVRRTPSTRKMKFHFTTGNQKALTTSPVHQCAVALPHTCAKVHGNSSPCSTMNRSEAPHKKKLAPLVRQQTAESPTPKRQAFLFPNPWHKYKKKESLFYVIRRCSSVPDLQITERKAQPIYLELIADTNENKNRSISESTAPDN